MKQKTVETSSTSKTVTHFSSTTNLEEIIFYWKQMQAEQQSKSILAKDKEKNVKNNRSSIKEGPSKSNEKNISENLPEDSSDDLTVKDDKDEGKDDNTSDKTVNSTTKSSSSVKYASSNNELENEFIRSLYAGKQLDYGQLFYTNNNARNGKMEGGVYSSTFNEDKQTGGILTPKEAEELFVKMQYSAALKIIGEINSKDKEEFNRWILFNPALFRMFETVYALTPEVDYNRMG